MSRAKGPRMVYTGIRVKNIDKSIRFYTKLLGMKLRGRGKNPSIRGEWAQLESPRTGQLLELNYYARGSPFHTTWKHGSELDHLCFRVANVDRVVARLQGTGVRRIGGPYLTPGWKMVDIADPNGICIELGSADRATRRG